MLKEYAGKKKHNCYNEEEKNTLVVQDVNCGWYQKVEKYGRNSEGVVAQFMYLHNNDNYRKARDNTTYNQFCLAFPKLNHSFAMVIYQLRSSRCIGRSISFRKVFPKELQQN